MNQLYLFPHGKSLQYDIEWKPPPVRWTLLSLKLYYWLGRILAQSSFQSNSLNYPDMASVRYYRSLNFDLMPARKLFLKVSWFECMSNIRRATWTSTDLDLVCADETNRMQAGKQNPKSAHYCKCIVEAGTSAKECRYVVFNWNVLVNRKLD